jgi:hypothetical protein
MVEVYPVRATFRGGASARWGGRSRDGRRGRRARVAGPRRRERAGPTRDAPWPAHAVLRAYSVPACAASSPGTGDPEAPRAAVAPRHTTAPGLMRFDLGPQPRRQGRSPSGWAWRGCAASCAMPASGASPPIRHRRAPPARVASISPRAGSWPPSRSRAHRCRSGGTDRGGSPTDRSRRRRERAG